MSHIRILLVLIFASLSVMFALDKSTDEEFNGPYPSWRNLKTVYGAVGDGVADDTAAWQAALNDLKNVQTNSWSVLYVPSGTYRITSTLTTVRSVHNDFLGAQIIGQDPVTTVLKWFGPTGNAMLNWDAWFDKVSRLTFDGRGIAGTGINRAGSFTTYSELSDLQIQDVTGSGIQLGNGSVQGIAEQTIIRNRFFRCGKGIAVDNYNSLDIYVWHCFFEDCGQGISCGTGAFHSYRNRFLRSTISDLKAGSNMIGSMVDNVSLNSKTFITGSGNLHMQGNRIYDCTGNAMDFTYINPVTLLDNVIRTNLSTPAIEFPQFSTSVVAGNTFASNLAWPLRPAARYFNHGAGSSETNGHPIDHLIDNDVNTWAVQSMTVNCGVIWNCPFGNPATAANWALTAPPASNDRGTGRDVQDVALYGSNDWGNTWTKLDERTGLIFNRSQRLQFAISAPGSYQLYAMRVLKNRTGDVAGSGSWMQLGGFELITASGTNLCTDSSGLLTGGDEDWGQMSFIDHNVVAPAARPAPATVEPWAFVPAVSRTIIEVTTRTGAAVQSAINQAAALPAGSRTVIHLPRGSYSIASTISIPANVALTLVGDGGSEYGSDLSWSGGATGPAVRLEGPSRATLRDFSVRAGGASGVDGLVIENADQVGGRIYGSAFQGGGNDSSVNVCGIAFDIDRIEQSDVTLTAFGFIGYQRGIRVTGGSIQAGGGSTPGQVAFLTGATSSGQRAYDVTQSGGLVVTGIWYEGGFAFTAPYIDLGTASRGSLSVVSQLVSAVMNDYPIVRTDSFPGSLTFLNNKIDHRDVTHLDFSGNGTATKVFLAGNDYANAGSQTIAQVLRDTTSPSAQFSAVASTFPTYTNKGVGASPSDTFLRSQLAQLRALRIEPALDRAPGVTDVKLLRVNVNGGNGKTAVVIRAAPPGSTVAPTISSQPTPVTVTAGQSAAFSITAAGTGPFTYVWKRGTTVVSGNTATLSLSNVQVADAGSYTCTVSNAAGSVVSNAATLTVNTAATAPAAPSGLTTAATSSTQITLTWTDGSSNETGFKIERKTVGGSFVQIALVGAGIVTYVDSGLTASTAYTYRVRATNVTGDSVYSNESTATTSASTATPPTVATPAVGPTAPVTGTTFAVTVLGGPAGSESGLSYTWSVVSGPAGGTAIFSPQGSNAAKNATATVTQAGVWSIQVVITRTSDGTTTVSGPFSVTVTQTTTSIALTGSSTQVAPGGTVQFTATARDQFTTAMATQPTLTWIATGGTVSATGLYTAGLTAGTYQVSASGGGQSASLPVEITATPGGGTGTPAPEVSSDGGGGGCGTGSGLAVLLLALTWGLRLASVRRR